MMTSEFKVGDEVEYFHTHKNYGSPAFNGSRGIFIGLDSSGKFARWECTHRVGNLQGNPITVLANIRPYHSYIEYDPNQQGDCDDDI